MTMSLKAKGYEKAPLFSNIIKEFDNPKTKQEEKTDEQIIEETLNLFK